MKRSDLNASEYPKYHGQYINSLPDEDFSTLLKESELHVIERLHSLTEENANFRYESDKWSIKELILHLIDCERIFVYRALRFARNDFSKVPGFEQDDYVKFSDAKERSLKSIIDEYKAQRLSTLQFFNTLTPEALQRNDPDGGRLSVRATAYFICGHERHHMNVLEERYLNRL